MKTLKDQQAQWQAEGAQISADMDAANAQEEAYHEEQARQAQYQEDMQRAMANSPQLQAFKQAQQDSLAQQATERQGRRAARQQTAMYNSPEYIKAMSEQLAAEEAQLQNNIWSNNFGVTSEEAAEQRRYQKLTPEQKLQQLILSGRNQATPRPTEIGPRR